MRAILQPVLLFLGGPRTMFVLVTARDASPWALLVRQYFFADWQFAGFLCTLIFVDTVTGVLRSWQKHQVSSRAFSRIFIKCLVYLLLLVLAHVMTSFTIKGKVNVVFQWFDTFIYCAMMAREALSVLENLAAVAPELVPKKLVKRLALFSEDPETALGELEAAPTPTPEVVSPGIVEFPNPSSVPTEGAIIN